MRNLFLVLVLIFSSCKKEEGNYNPFLDKEKEVSRDSYVFKYEGQEFNETSLPKELRVARYRLELDHYLKMYNAVEAYSVRVHLQAKKGYTDFYGRRDQVPSLLKFYEEAITDKKAKEEFKKNKAKYMKPGMTEAQGLMQTKYQMTMDIITPEYMNNRFDLYKKGKLHINLLPPDIRETGFLFKDFPRLGERESKYQLIVISNYNCKRCRKFNERIKKLYQKYGSDISYIHVNLSFNPDDTIFDGVLAGHCVGIGEKQKYWQFHKEVYEASELDNLPAIERLKMKNALSKIFQKLKIDEKKIFSCMENLENRKLVTQNILSLKALGVKRTPTFYLNGRQLILLEDGEGLELAFDDMAKSLGL